MNEITGPHYFSIDFFGLFDIHISETTVVAWIVMAIIMGLVLFITHDMKKDNPSKKQMVAEMLVKTMNNLVKTTMGEKNIAFAPYMATIFSFSMFGSLISLLGLRSVTADFNTIFGWALVTFTMIQYFKLKNNGLGGYLKGFTQPIPLMTPLNLLSELATPVSMSFRHYGNIAGGMVISSLLYYSLGGIARAFGSKFEWSAIGIPAVLSVYFDLFTGFMQAFIFIMLSMAFIGPATEKE